MPGDRLYGPPGMNNNRKLIYNQLLSVVIDHVLDGLGAHRAEWIV